MFFHCSFAVLAFSLACVTAETKPWYRRGLVSSVTQATFNYALAFKKESLGGVGYSQKNWVRVCGPLPKPLTLFMTKICDIPYPIYDLTKNTKPYLRPGGRRGGLMVSALDSGANGPGSSPGRRHCVVFLGKTLNSHSASLHPGV